MLRLPFITRVIFGPDDGEDEGENVVWCVGAAGSSFWVCVWVFEAAVMLGLGSVVLVVVTLDESACDELAGAVPDGVGWG